MTTFSSLRNLCIAKMPPTTPTSVTDDLYEAWLIANPTADLAAVIQRGLLMRYSRRKRKGFLDVALVNAPLGVVVSILDTMRTGECIFTTIGQTNRMDVYDYVTTIPRFAHRHAERALAVGLARRGILMETVSSTYTFFLADIAEAAAEGGYMSVVESLACIRAMRANGGEWDTVWDAVSVSNFWRSVLRGAARGGHRDLMNHAKLQIIQTEETREYLAVYMLEGGHLTMALEEFARHPYYPSAVFAAAATSGNIEILRHIITMRLWSKYPRSTVDACIVAIAAGRLDMLLLLNEVTVYKPNDKLEDERQLMTAVAYDHVDIVAYLMEDLKFQSSRIVEMTAINEQSFDVIRYMIGRGIRGYFVEEVSDPYVAACIRESSSPFCFSSLVEQKGGRKWCIGVEN